MGYARTQIARPDQAVDGLIVAHDADDALRYAVSAFPCLHLMTYEVTFQLNNIEGPQALRR